MDDEQILDRLSERPKEFVGLTARQIRKGIEAENPQKSQENRMVKTYVDFENAYRTAFDFLCAEGQKRTADTGIFSPSCGSRKTRIYSTTWIDSGRF